MQKEALSAAFDGVEVFAPHPDDEVFGCGGLIALLAGEGIPVSVTVITDGGFGEYGLDKAGRKVESQSAASVLGYENVNFWDYPDQGVKTAIGLSQRIQEYLLASRPSLVLSPSPWEVHIDHLAVCKAVSNAVESIYAESTTYRPSLWYYETGIPMPRANWLIDISSVMEKKIQAMACFKSQLEIQDYSSQFIGLSIYRSYHLPKRGANVEAFQCAAANDIFTSEICQSVGANKPTQHSAQINDSSEEEKTLAIATLTNDLEKLRCKYDAILHSRSWRLTGPLRYLANSFRGLIRTLKASNRQGSSNDG